MGVEHFQLSYNIKSQSVNEGPTNKGLSCRRLPPFENMTKISNS